MNARDIALAAVALVLGCLGPTAALVAGMQGSCGAAPIVVGSLIAAALLGSAGVVLCRDDDDEIAESQR
ncbi:hypothetical protein [Collinsella aerofaciens]|uniref:hypothetical protein n=1 Tax=Collinsella aerofaciens TaxID=74426 RepID=UPI003D78BF89